MKNTGGPIPPFPLAERARREWERQQSATLPDFTDTSLTFRHLTDGRLRGTRRLFRLMGLPWLTRLMGSLGVRAVNYHLPGASWMVKNTLYKQFVGGASLEEAQRSIATLAGRRVSSILDFGAEGKDTEAGMQQALEESLRATAFASTTQAVIGSVVKLSSLFPAAVLERYNGRTIDFSAIDDPELAQGIARLDRICAIGRERGCEVYLDAEESWIQHTIDQLAEEMMQRYNKRTHTVFTTCQLYRHDRLEYLKQLHLRSRQKDFKLALKIVRGAYMVKERKRALADGMQSPIQPDLNATHRDYDAAVAFCLEHRADTAFCVATHNEASITKLLVCMQELGVARDHPSVRFSQLLGMSGNLTFNLAEGGYNVSKYMVYGPVREVLPYLLRRAQENTSVMGETGRELRMIEEEIVRRGL